MSERVRERAGEVVSILRGGLGPRQGCRRADRPATARAWYERGLELEPTDVGAARHAYQRALARDPQLADAACNLGRLLHEEGDLGGAEACYRLALCAGRQVAVYWFNLGVACEDQGRRAEAIACYGEALARDAQLADAHFNLARLYERAGDLVSARAAVRHFRAYRALRHSA
jgi:tetratricopeptide (TPR) repeat protein